MKLNTIIFSVMFATLTRAEYQGILINGEYGGTQLYDPFNTPHAQGNLQLGLQTGNAHSGAAVINGQLAYFASGYEDVAIISLHIRQEGNIHCVQKNLGMREFENSPVGFAAVFTLTCQLAKLLQLKQDFALNKHHFSSELRLTK